MAEILWKGIYWKAAYGDLSVKELLTILKGFGPMETVHFEKPGCFRGKLSLSLSSEGVKDVILYHLEILGPLKQGRGRAALKVLKDIFRGGMHVEDIGAVDFQTDLKEVRGFWLKMVEEGLVDSLMNESELPPGPSVNRTGEGVPDGAPSNRSEHLPDGARQR